MATKSTPYPPPVKTEREPTPPSQPQLQSPPPSETALVKQELQDLANTNNLPTTHTPENQQPPPPHDFIDSVTELRNLSAALNAFQRGYDELQEHLDFIRTAIDSKLPQLLNKAPSLPPPEQQLAISLTETPSPNTTKQTVPESDNSEPKANNEKQPRSELESLCEMMCSRGLRKYLVSHLSNVNKLREETPKALKCARNPAKLVLECVGRFFLQGRKAYTKNSPMIPAREASVLVLECFLLMGCDGIWIEPAVKEEADLAAVAWKKRLVNEGSVAHACKIDGRGLLLFIGCFGIPSAFKNGDIRDLIQSSKAREISGVLRRSSVLLARIPEIIEEMLKNNMEIEAVGIAYTFGVEDRFHPQTILTSFFRESKETWKRANKAAQGSFAAVNEANKKQLADLKSIKKCLEDHKIDASNILSGWQINEMILRLEKDIADLDKKEKTIQKRKADEIESSNKLKTQEAKRLRFACHGQQTATGLVDSKSSYDGLAPMNLLDGGLPGHISGYSASPSILHGSGASSLPGNIAGSVTGNGGNVLVAGVGAGISAGTGGVLRSSAGVHGGMLFDTVRQMANHNGQPYGWHGDAAIKERLVGHGFAGQPSSIGANGLFGPSPSLQSFPGLPNPLTVGVSSRSSTSDLYHFADAVVESESYHSSASRTGGTVPPVASAHRSSYLY